MSEKDLCKIVWYDNQGRRVGAPTHMYAVIVLYCLPEDQKKSLSLMSYKMYYTR